ncbi:hypothetical protein ACQHIV_33775 [Kribbella sp. GL6]|uniref:hypothetical protein n=1 Tax=Kribbella sp. GL6 TaxID=3419765 RepID=UPI003D01EB42
MRISRIVAAAVSAVVLVAGAQVEAAWAVGEPSVAVVSPAANSSLPLGDVPVTVAVDLGGAASGRVDVTLAWNINGSVEISAGTCDNGCEATVTLRIGDWGVPFDGSNSVGAKLTTSDGVTVYGGNAVSFQAPSRVSDVRYVRDGQQYSDAVADNSGQFRITTQYVSSPDDVAELRLVDYRTETTLLTATTPFSVKWGTAYYGLADLDFSAVPSGSYRLDVKGRNAAGYYESGEYFWVQVNHENPAVFDTGVDEPSVAPGTFGGNLVVTGPLLSGSRPDQVRMTVDGVDRHVFVTPSGWNPGNWQKSIKQRVQFTMDGPALGVGTYKINLRLLDTAGRVIGTPTDKTLVVTDFTASLTASKLVVGRPGTVTMSADPPKSDPLDDCGLSLREAGQTTWRSVGNWCLNPPVQSLRKTAAVSPRNAGTATFGLNLAARGYYKGFTFPVPVYAERRATVSAPAVPYGGHGTAKVVVQDLRTYGTWSAAPAGITVYLQRQTVGTMRWVTLGSAKSATGGVASIPFTSATNGAFRAVLASSVPGETVITKPIGAVSSATVGWRIAPRTAVRGRAVTYQAIATPYDVGATAWLQVRKAGATKWTTVRTVKVLSNRIAVFGYAFPSAGSWAVRVYRPATKQHAAGLSMALGVKVG